MRRFRWLLLAWVATLGVVTIGVSAAQAATFYVSLSGNDANPCTEPVAPCKTIAQAITDSELAPGAATIQVAAGVYEETIRLAVPADDGITIEGAGSGAGGTELAPASVATEATADIGVPGGSVTLANLSIVNSTGDTQPGIESESETTLDNVTVQMLGTGDGIEQREIGSLTMNGGGVTMESGSGSVAIGSEYDPLTVDNATVTVANGAEATGIEAGYAPMSVSNTTVNVGNTGGVAVASSLGATTVANVSVTDGTEKDPGLEFVLSKSVSLENVQLTMTNAKDTDPGVELEYGSADTFDALNVSGAWEGPPLGATLTGLALRDSHLTANAAGASPALEDEAANEGSGVLVQRSVLQAGPTAIGAVAAIDGNLTVDSSEILGGKAGVYFDQAGGKERTLTVAASTIDAGRLGEADATEASGIDEIADSLNSVANANIVGSIVLEKQEAKIEPGGKSATISTAKKYGAKISYSDSQPATTTFTVLRETSGLKQGKSCKKPSKTNRHGKRCAMFTAVGSFSHVDLAGVNSLHFSGRIKGRKLAPGSYRLQVVAHDAAGNGTAVGKGFTIK
jgi:hypothetical protein